MEPKNMYHNATRAQYLDMINESMHTLIASPKVGWVLLEDDTGGWSDVDKTDSSARNIILYMRELELKHYCCVGLQSLTHLEGTLYVLYKN